MLDTRSPLDRILSERAWITMAVLVLFFFALAGFSIELDEQLKIDPGPGNYWLYGGSAESAISVLSAIASSTVTVAGVIFSATFVALQLASSQYTPRVIQSLAQNPRLQLVLGSFLGTFCYSIMVLRSIVPSSSDGTVEFVPVLSVSITVLLALISVGIFIYYVRFGMTSIQPAALIDSAGSYTFDLLSRVRNATAPHDAILAKRREFVRPDGPGDFLPCPKSGYVRHVDIGTLYLIAVHRNLHIEVGALIGSYVFKGEPLFEIFGSDADTVESVRDAMLATVDIGEERTPDQDVDFGFRRVADIMSKALSPAINDPTTATYCFNKLCDLILTLSMTDSVGTGLRSPDRVIRVSWKRQQFDHCVQTAFEQLRYYAKHDSSIIAYMLAQFERLILQMPEELRGPVLDEAHALKESGLSATDSTRDRQMIEAASGWLQIWGSQTSGDS